MNENMSANTDVDRFLIKSVHFFKHLKDALIIPNWLLVTFFCLCEHVLKSFFSVQRPICAFFGEQTAHPRTKSSQDGVNCSSWTVCGFEATSAKKKGHIPLLHTFSVDSVLFVLNEQRFSSSGKFQ